MGWLAPLNPPLADWAGRRVWLVGASTGIGAALARALAARGARLALSARNVERLHALAAELEAPAVPGGAGDIVVAALDVTRAGDFERVRDALVARWGGLDVVVFNAGTYRPLRAWELTPARVRETLETNLLGPMDGVAAVLPQLLAQGTGAVALVGSVAGYGGLPKAVVYGPSKAALINFAETLYLDLAPRGIGVFLIDPGFVATPLTAANDFHMPALIGPDEAAAQILRGFARGEFEIHFPRRFTWAMKVLACLPRRAYFALIRRVTGL
jgi:NAD(P)-dependent dehydrogenase (short-subunit alcohol dehydrogenase family)